MTLVNSLGTGRATEILSQIRESLNTDFHGKGNT